MTTPDMPAAETNDDHFVVAALYKFIHFADFENLQPGLLETCLNAGVRGTLLLAREGINGTIAGTRTGIDAAVNHIRSLPGCGDLDVKESFALTNPFYRMKVRLKKEIVTMGVENIDPNQIVGTYVDPENWNDLISDPNVIVIDTRNDYEVSIGTFRGAIDPKTTTFREFPNWFNAQENLQAPKLEGKKIAMFCTGGIRCEKSTAFVKGLGIEDVFHLKGGILKYLETVPQEKSLWDGECFVFDHRVSVKHDLQLGSYDMCHACRNPIDDDDKKSSHYVPGVSCPKCYATIDTARKQRFQQRQKQIELAKSRGQQHLGQGVQNKSVKPAKGYG